MYSVSAHSDRTVAPMELVVQAAGVAHHFPQRVTPPYCGRFGATVGARQVIAPSGKLKNNPSAFREVEILYKAQQNLQYHKSDLRSNNLRIKFPMH